MKSTESGKRKCRKEIGLNKEDLQALKNIASLLDDAYRTMPNEFRFKPDIVKDLLAKSFVELNHRVAKDISECLLEIVDREKSRSHVESHQIKKQIDEWIDSPEREKSIQESIECAKATKKHLKEVTRIDPNDLNKPIDI